MNLLAIDTSSNACSVAARVGNHVVEEHAVKPRQHTRILISMIETVFKQAGITSQDLDAVVVGNGPGSFIGMRIAASVAQGISFGTGIKIIPVSSLAAIAAEVFGGSSANDVVVAQDARMDEVYVGWFRRGDSGAALATADEKILAVGRIGSVAPGSVAAGMAWQTCSGLAESNNDRLLRIEPITVPRARFLLPAGFKGVHEDAAVPPAMLVPSYLRAKVAEPASNRSV